MLPWSEIVIRLALSALFSGIIGIERERKNWSAGMRTHMMVGVGSALIIMVSAFGFDDVMGKANVVLDPSRIAAQVISGIGFIGAGTILFLKQGVIRGLTTAAGLWTVAAIGLATGGGMYFAAGATTIIAIIILWVLQPFEKRFSRRFRQKSLLIRTQMHPPSADVLNQLMAHDKTTSVNITFDAASNESVILVGFQALKQTEVTSLLHDLQQTDGIKELTWQK